MPQKGRTPPPRESERTVTFEYDGDVNQAAYDATRVQAPGFLDALNKQAVMGDRIGPTLTYYATLITSWDLKGNDGQVLPITEDTLLSLEETKFPALRQAISNDADSYLDQKRRPGR